MKVRLKRKPQTGDQLPDGGLYTDQYLAKTNPSSNPSLEVRGDEPKVERDDSNVEAEKGEFKIAGNLQTLTKIGGKKHGQGGTPILADPGDFIVSDRIKVNPNLIEGLKLPDAKKNTTWAKYLGKQVDPKYFNDLSYIQSKQMNGEEVDPYKAATAKHKLPKYQTTLSKIALGNELSKAAEGKDFTIPQVAIPALMTLEQSTLTKGPQKMARGGQVKMPNGGSSGGAGATGYWGQRNPYTGNINFNSKVRGQINPNAYRDEVSSWYPSGVDKVPFDGNNTLLWKDTDPNWDQKFRAATPPPDYNNTLPFQSTQDKPIYYQNTDSNKVYKNSSELAPITVHSTIPDTPPRISPEDSARYANISPSLTGRPTSLPGTKPSSFQRTAKNVTDQKRADANADFNNKSNVPNVPYSMFDQLALAGAIGNKPKTYYPWAQKENPEYITPNYDTPDYNAILSSQRTQGDLVDQISDSSTARAVGSFQPGLIQGINQETQRSRQFNIQQNQQAQFYNNQTKNRADSINAQISTQLHDKNVLSDEQRDQADNIWKQGIFGAATNMVGNRNQMQAFQVAMPQYTVDEFGNYRYNNNGANADQLKRGTNSPLKSIMAQAESIADPDTRKAFLNEAFKHLWGK